MASEPVTSTPLTAYAPPGVAPRGGYSTAVGAGDLVFVSGQVGTVPETGEVAGPDVASQTRQAMLNVGRALEAAGVGWGAVAKTTVYLTHAPDLQGMDAVYREFFDGVLPARATVTVAALARDDLVVEIDAIAVR